MKLNKYELILIFLFFLLAFLIRGYKIEDFLFFGYEQGRDALVIENIYKLKDFTLVGPKTDIGGIFHGPYFYYLMIFPYFVSQGNPFVASYFLILLGSASVVLFYFFAKDLFKSRIHGLAASIIFLLSFEYILYSRWLSNVSPAIPFVVLSYFMLWKFVTLEKKFYFIWFVAFASIASQFEIILVPQFLFFLILLFLFGLLKFKNFKIKLWLYSFVLIALIFSPLILFDLRNQNITTKTILGIITGTGGSLFQGIFANIKLYFLQLGLHLQRSLFNIENAILILFFSFFVISGLFLYLKKEKRVGFFLLSWFWMSLPLILIGPGNPHFYLGVGLVAILALVAGLDGWITSFPKLVFIPLIIIVLLLGNFFQTFNNLTQNKNIFFVTIQDDLNLKDQKRILDYLHNDSKGEPYKFLAFTIPSLHPEGWQYLHKYFYPQEAEKDGKLVYIVIEKNVYPIWENKWISELGENELIEEKMFGKLRVQKRLAH